MHKYQHDTITDLRPKQDGCEVLKFPAQISHKGQESLADGNDPK